MRWMSVDLRTRRDTEVLAIILVLALLEVTAGEARVAFACSAAPLAGCRTATTNLLQVRRADDPGRRALRWDWRQGQPTLQAGFGYPTRDTAHILCLYDATGLVLDLVVPPQGTCDGKPCWTARTGRGFAYANKAATADGVQALALDGSAAAKAKIRLKARGTSLPDPPLPLSGSVTVQLSNTTSGVCFESVFDASAVREEQGDRLCRLWARAHTEMPAVVTPLPSAGCGGAGTGYTTGANTDALDHDGLTRTFGVYLPPAYDFGGSTAAPLVLILHGGFGSGDQVFEHAQVAALADDEGVIVVSPDGVASPLGIRTWNAGRCCGYAESQDIDDVGFVAALLDRLAQSLCVDLRRVHAMGISNGAMLSYRLACELSPRIAAIGPVAGVDMTAACAPTRPVPVMHVHGTADMNVPWQGGLGCGLAGVPFTSVPDSVATWAAYGTCKGAPAVLVTEGDGRCERQGTCPGGAEVVLCAIAGGGHTWPGGLPPATSGLPGCPFGAQSTTFDATRQLYEFFRRHPLR